MRGGISLWFWYDFPNDQLFEHFFMHVLIFHSYIFFREMSIQALCPFLNSILFFFADDFRSSLYTLVINLFSGIWKYVFSFFGLLFYSDNTLWMQKIKKFHEVQFVCFFFVAYAFGVMSKKLLPNSASWSFFSMFF